jgi:crotonobetainyl-CoA:carnitine CoA-transferase CaiB-like acyl-CoA transferase
LWAGPLCADLLERRGATVVKVEDPRRPDGGRGQPLFELLNAGKRPEAIGVDSPALVDLLRQADVVVTSARPRVFEQLDLQPARFLGESPTVWVGVTAHGWDGPGRNRVGFGDDAAVAGGLVAWTDHGPAFVADAVADPLCGTLAAAAAVECLAAGGSWFVDVSLAGVAAYAVSLAEAGPAASAVRTDAGWALADGTPVLPPRARSIRR